MIYSMLLSYPSSYADPELESHREDIGFLTLVVEAPSLESACEKCRQRLIDLHDNDESFYDVFSFFLEDLAEFNEVPRDTKLLHHFVPHCFDGVPSLILQVDPEGDSRICHYDLNDESEGVEMEPFLDISRDRKLARPLFKSLLRKKNRGILPEFQEMSDGDIYELYIVEGCLSSEIADLFNVTTNQVNYRRRKIDATVHEEALYDYLVDRRILRPIPFNPS